VTDQFYQLEKAAWHQFGIRGLIPKPFSGVFVGGKQHRGRTIKKKKKRTGKKSPLD